MSTFNDAARASQDDVLNAVRQSQQAVVDAVATWAKAVQEVVPAAPVVPGAGNLPRPEEVVENTFEFAHRLLDAQRDFARSLIAASAPAHETTVTVPTGAQTRD